MATNESAVLGASQEKDAEGLAQAAVDAVWAHVTTVKKIRRRDGRVDDFNPDKLARSVKAACKAAGVEQEQTVKRLIDSILSRLKRQFDGHTIPSTDNLREIAGLAFIDHNLLHAAKRYLGYRSEAKTAEGEPKYGNGLTVDRFYTKAGVHPYDEIEWEVRDASITNEKGKVIFEQKKVEMPKSYSQTATNIIVSKYFRGRLGTPEREVSMRQVVDRLAKTMAQWGRLGGYFKTAADADTFEAELTSILINQRAAFNSPVWFNVGVNPHPQCSACFINSVQDDMRSILNLAVTEGMLFKFGSGTGSNLSSLRSSKENLGNSSGKSSGPVSFMRGFDAFAGVIKSGGKTRRAAKMVILNIDHPDIEEFIWCKAKEEKKAHALIDAGFDGGINGEAYSSVFFQNANNSVRVTDEFMKAAEEGRDFWTKNILGGEPCDKYEAKQLLRDVAQAAWECGDPGMQYDTTVNNWHTCSNTDRIHASNPCSEYMFLNDSSCNLASVNLMQCRDASGKFDVKAFEHVCRIMITAQEILVGFSSYPTPAIEQNSHEYRPLGLGYANLGALLMAMGLPYDSTEGRNVAAAITSVMSGTAYEQSTYVAENLGTFNGYATNREPMLQVMAMHRSAAYAQDYTAVPSELATRARTAWDEALARGEAHGYRNAQISVLAPTGTIGFMMDCDTTGVEPAISLVSYKWLVGGGMLKIVNRTVPEALHSLGYNELQIRDILTFIDEHDTIEGAPHLKLEHLPVFDCAFKPAKGLRSINYKGHIHMMAAVQPFLSGAISKTVNLPTEATVEDIMEVYLESWRLGLKAVAIYRDGCKRAQPLTTTKQEVSDKVEAKAAPAPVLTPQELTYARRRRLPDERKSITHKFKIGSHSGFITVGLYDEGTPGEIFITLSKEGSTLRGMLDAFATSVSIGLQYGVPLKTLVSKFSHVRFEPSGFTQNPNIRVAKSVIDYIFRWLAVKFLDADECAALGVNFEPPAIIETEEAKMEHLAAKQFETSEHQPSLLDRQAEADAHGSSLLTSTIDNQSDAPACDTCGSIMVRNAACYKCLNCGATSGCS
ncbi:vitamin B12-dependent ribonucleotide reductase [Candidatus Uhrbacteria bacterium]|nr:vitamin B12-dependent ribonucleotide reductase [Candidatus Uhrbacteria bacterium]